MFTGVNMLAQIFVFYLAVQGAKSLSPAGCYDSNVFVEAGQTHQKSPCEFCYCPENGGDLMCDRVMCSMPACSQPVLHEGDCCPSCPIVEPQFCVDDGVLVPVGESYPKNACETCFCDGKTLELHCEHMMCSMPNCENPEMKPGDCCPSCPSTGKTLELPCEHIMCSMPNCENPEMKPGDCCPSCPSYGSHGCKDVDWDLILPVGETYERTPCETCSCYGDGQDLVCHKIVCDVPSCKDAVLLPGDCCMSCP